MYELLREIFIKRLITAMFFICFFLGEGVNGGAILSELESKNFFKIVGFVLS